MDINRVELKGHLGQNPQLKKANSGRNVALLSVATNKTWYDEKQQKQERVTFNRVIFWERIADVCGRYLKKGDPILVVGELVTRHYDDGSGTRYVTEVQGRELHLLKPAAETAPADYKQEGGYRGKDEDIPF
jgi:single-strand DNA-binding protein